MNGTARMNYVQIDELGMGSLREFKGDTEVVEVVGSLVM